MRVFKRVVLSAVVIFILLILGAWLYIQGLRPQYNGEVEIPGLEGEVEVYYDDYGIPHIYGANLSDTYFAFGYVHAQDRLFQMDLLRRVGAGRLSEFFGTNTVEVDRLFHTLGVPEYSRASADNFEEMDPELQTLVMRYLDGINHYIQVGPKPIEYLIGGLPSEPFEVVDLYHISGYMAFSFAQGLKTDPLVQYIQDQIGIEHLRELALNHYEGQELAPSGRDSVPVPQFSSDVVSQLDKLPIPFFVGSNNWAISGELTRSGKPILANDTHIKYSQPATWFEAHLEYPGFKLYGNYLAGVPLALVGHNDRLGWGLTMFENDDTDFYFESYHPEDTTKVRQEGNVWTPVEYRKVIIRVKGGDDDTLIIRKTPHGPIVNEFIDQHFAQPISMYWTYTKRSNNLPVAFYKLNNARNLSEARNAVKKIHAPGLNIAYADVDNNIALWSAAELVHRPAHVNPKLILDGASGEDDPIGFYPFAANPQVENPPSGFVFSANSQHDTTLYGVMHPGYYTANVRMRRIRELLSADRDWTVEKMKAVVTDHYSKADAELAMHFYQLIEDDGDDQLVAFFAPLANWDGAHILESSEPVLYYPLLAQLMHQTFADELGEDQYNNYIKTHLMKRSNFKVFEMEESVWFDDVNTPEIESKSDIVVRSAQLAMNKIQEQYGTENIPDWGTLHRVEFAHPMGSVSPLDKLFNIGPLPIRGTNESVNQQAFVHDRDGKYPVQHGPQMRILIDMADPDSSISINPSGQSGNVLSDHYGDQAEMFVNEEFRPQLMNRQAIEKVSENKLIFRPE